MAQQARAILRPFLSLESRHDAKLMAGILGAQSTGSIHSLRTLDKYVGSLKLAGDWARNEHGLKHLEQLTPALAQEYLESRVVNCIGQKQLDADRVALGYVVGKENLDRARSIQPTCHVSRAYTEAQVLLVASGQSPRNSLATEIAWRAGLRAHELLTIRPVSESNPSAHREWDARRFTGRQGQIYVVTGKGGLRREVLLDGKLATRLEVRRLEAPISVVDRGIRYQPIYDLSGGNAWSKSFAKSAVRLMGWSRGAHGVRHSYAQERMSELQNLGVPYEQARLIVSQEMGHFRPDIIECYLR